MVFTGPLVLCIYKCEMIDSLLDKDDTKISLGLNVKIISTVTSYNLGLQAYRYRFSLLSTLRSCYIIWIKFKKNLSVYNTV